MQAHRAAAESVLQLFCFYHYFRVYTFTRGGASCDEAPEPDGHTITIDPAELYRNMSSGHDALSFSRSGTDG